MKTTVITDHTQPLQPQILFQALVARIQKERDAALAEAASCRERAEAAAAAANRAARDRDSATTELDVLRERWEKAHQQHQKLTVRGMS